MRNWLDEIRELTRVRVVLFFREPEAVFWVLIFPLLLATLLGFAFRRGTEAEPSRVAVLPGGDTASLITKIDADDELTHMDVPTREIAFRQLHRGLIDALVEAGDPPRVHYDPSRPEGQTGRLRVLGALSRTDESTTPRIEAVPATAVGGRYIDFLFPGLLGMNLMGTGMWSLGFAIAELRERKVLKRLLVTPMRRSSFLLSLVLARLLNLVLEVVVLGAFAVWLLGVPLRGNLLAFGWICLLGAFAFAGIGLLTVSRTKTIQGASGILNLVMIPMWLFSGVFFAYERFPDMLHPILRVLPLAALNDALRALMLDGVSLWTTAPQMATLLAWGLVSYLLAIKVFRWA